MPRQRLCCDNPKENPGKKQTGEYIYHQDALHKLNRKESSIYRLRTGHCGLRGHLHRIGVADTSSCSCGQDDQTPYHVKHCPVHHIHQSKNLDARRTQKKKKNPFFFTADLWLYQAVSTRIIGKCLIQ
jgi:hypothetical protein